MIFLDEIGELREATQAKLLKVLEEGVVRRLGATETEPADVWVISATNADLEAAVRQRAFREDLYHRLAVLTLRLPPLRERGRDVILLARRFLDQACTEYGLSPKRLSPDAEERILRHPWPGNVRELDNVMERVALLAEGDDVTASMLELRGGSEVASVGQPVPTPAAASLEDAMRNHLLAALEQTRWNISRTAVLLDISRNTVRARIDRFGLRPSTGSKARSARLPAASMERPVSLDARPAPILPPPVGPATPIRWESRRITFLRARLIMHVDNISLLESNRALDVLLEKIRSFGGQIDELSPQGIGVVFGLEPVEDAPRRAAHAAMAMQKAAERGRRESAEGFDIKTGIHVGEVLVAHTRIGPHIDAETKRDHWAALDATLGKAAAGVTLVSSTALPFLERRFDLVAEPGLPSSPYRLKGRERAGLAPEGQMAGFVGRGLELSLLKSRLAAARAGNGQVVGIGGEAGIGKSRLLHEFRQALRGEGVTYLEGHCLSYGTDIPYLPLIEILRNGCRVTDDDGPGQVAQKLRVTLQYLGMEPDEAVAHLMRFLGFKEGTEPLEGATPEAIRTRTAQILRQMCLTTSRRRPLVIVVEDLHWIDPASESLTAMVDNLTGVPLLLILTYRPDYLHAWLDRAHVTKVPLQPLSAEDSLSVLKGIVTPEQLSGTVAQEILEKADGNPFFLEELGRTVREHGSLPAPLDVPRTVQEVLLARINHLPERERRLLQSAAAIGKDVPVSLLRLVADLPDAELEASLHQLRASEFLYETSLGPELELTFKHGLTHEVAYESLSASRRKELHAGIVTATETSYPTRRAELVERLAFHSLKGEVWEKAVRYCREAGAKAFGRSAHRTAVSYFDQAVDALRHLPQTPETTERSIDVRLDLRYALMPLGEFRRVFECLSEAGELAESVNDQRRLGRVAAFLTNYFHLMGDHERAVEYGRRASDIAGALHDLPMGTVANANLGLLHYSSGAYREAAEAARRNVRALQGDLAFERFGSSVLPSVLSRTCLAWSLGELGEFPEGARLAAEGLEIAEKSRQPLSLIYAHLGAGTLCLRQGTLPDAVHYLERAFAICRDAEIALLFSTVALPLASAYALAGRGEDALHMLDEAAGHARSIGDPIGRLAATGGRGEACLAVGRYDQALPLARQYLEQRRGLKARGFEGWALKLLGDTLSRQTPPEDEEAEASYREALGIAAALEMRPLSALCHLELGLLHRRRGHLEIASEELGRAEELLRAMGMTHWLDQMAGDGQISR